MGALLKLYGVIDILAGFLIYAYAPLPDFLKIFILIIMLFKGVPSLFG